MSRTTPHHPNPIAGRARRSVAPTNIPGYVEAVGRRKLPYEASLRSRNISDDFFTICCLPRCSNQLCRQDIAQAPFQTVEFRHRRGDWFVHVLLLMPDHLHMLVSFPEWHETTKIIHTWKSYVARRLEISWQRDFFDHRLSRNESFDEEAEYIAKTLFGGSLDAMTFGSVLGSHNSSARQSRRALPG